MKILYIHNQYKQVGGEDGVINSEMTMLNLHSIDLELLIANNHMISNIIEKLKVVIKINYSNKYKKIVLERINRFKPDIIHVHNLFPLLTPSIYDACIESKVPVVQTLHNYRTICSNALLMRNGHICELCISGSHYNAALYRCYRNSFLGSLAVARMLSYHQNKKTWQDKVDTFIALTHFAKTKFIEGGLPAKKIKVKPNFFNEERPIFGNKNSRKGALFVGRISHEKGIKTLLKAWETLDVPLRIAGDGPLMRMVKEKNTSKIVILGKISSSQVSQEMAKASFLVMPSEWYEGFPMVIVEAFAHGLPVVASNLGGMSEIVENNITGLHFEAGNPKDLAEKVLWMHNHPNECKKMGETARKMYEEKYTPERNYHMLMDIYQKTIETYEAKNS